MTINIADRLKPELLQTYPRGKRPILSLRPDFDDELDDIAAGPGGFYDVDLTDFLDLEADQADSNPDYMHVPGIRRDSQAPRDRRKNVGGDDQEKPKTRRRRRRSADQIEKKPDKFGPADKVQRRWNIDISGPSWRFYNAMLLLNIMRKVFDEPDKVPFRITKDLRKFLVDDKVQWLNLRWRRLWRGNLVGRELERFKKLLFAVNVQRDLALRIPIEAGIMADLPQRQLAIWTGLDEEVIALYEDYLFDMRGMPALGEMRMYSFLPPQWSEPDKEMVLFIYTTLRLAGPYPYAEMLRGIAKLGQFHDLETPEGRLAERIEIMFQTWKRRHWPIQWRVQRQLAPTGPSATMVSAALEDIPGNEPFYLQPLASRVRRRLISGLEAFANTLPEAVVEPTPVEVSLELANESADGTRSNIISETATTMFCDEVTVEPVQVALSRSAAFSKTA